MLLADDVLRTVLYYDVFAWPLTRAELARFCAPGAPEAVDAACDVLVEDGVIAADGPFVGLPGRVDVERRRRSNRHAERLWPAARRAAAVLARLPWVRGVLITGGLSKNAVDEDADVDFLLLVAPGRVWVAKSGLQVARRALPGPVRECFCTNYLLAEDALLLDDQNAFSAMELATAVPMYNGELCARFLERNAWARAHVPGLDWAIARARNAPDLPRSPLRAAERVPAGALDEAALSAWDAFWNRKYAFLDDATRAQRFKRRPEIATNHLVDFQEKVLAAYGERLARHGLPVVRPAGEDTAVAR